ncbi:unnamed protein product, partial [Natator depressus]
DDETESTETSILKSHLVTEVPVLASPDLLSEVSEMKQDLIKMTAILTTDPSDQSGSIKVKDLGKATEEEPGEPFEIVERVKEDLEKVNEILRCGTYTREDHILPRSHSGRELVEEEWVIVSDEEIEEARQNVPLEVIEPACIELRIGKGTTEIRKTDMTGMVDYLTEDLKTYVSLHEVEPQTFQEDLVGERFEAVVVSRGSEKGEQGSPTAETQGTQEQRKPALEIKKPVRRKLKDKQRQKEGEGETQSSEEQSGLTKFSSEESLDDEPGLTPAAVPDVSAVSPVIEETPIGSIKDKVKALQKRVEDEQKVRSKLPVRIQPKEITTERPVTRPAQAKKIVHKAQPPVSPSAKTERLEETMSVRELMKAFQSGQDPSKNKSGLFEHKAIKQKQQLSDKEPTQREAVYLESETGQVPPPRKTNKKERLTVKQTKVLKIDKDSPSKKGPKASSDYAKEEPVDRGQVKEQSYKRTEPFSPVFDEESSKEAAVVKESTAEDDQGDTDFQISPDRKTSTDFSDVIKEELESNDKYQQFRHLSVTEEGELHLEQVLTSPFSVTIPSEYVKDGFLPALSLQSGAFDGSSESLKHEGVADSPGSLLDGTPQISSEESYKHEGLAETPETSPESLSFSPKKTDEEIGETKESTTVHRAAETCSPKELSPMKGERGIAAEQLTADIEAIKSHPDHLSEQVPSAPEKGAGKLTDSSSASIMKDVSSAKESKSIEHTHVTKSSEMYDSCLEKEMTCEHHVVVRSPQGLELSLPSHHSESFSPVADESLAISHKDSLEASPVLEDNSSHKTPDSLEPSPMKESPCRDSLESSPVEQKAKAGILTGQVPLQSFPTRAEMFPELASMRSRILRDPDGSAEDDSLEQTSLMESSGKSPLSPDTPSSEEISYEITPKTADSQALSNISKSATITEVSEEPEDDSESEPKKRFTPEEEMFKMVTKIKMFDELEQEAKQKREYIKDKKQEESSSIPDSGVAYENEETEPTAIEEKHIPTVVMSSADIRKSSSSSESEPELTQLKKEADSGLLMEPVIRVQPPSPHLSGVDSSSSPEEAGFQPIDPKQHVFRMEEYKAESDKPTKGDKEEPPAFGDSCKAYTEESNIFHSDTGIIAETDESKCCYSTDESETISPNGPVTRLDGAFYHAVGDDAQKEVWVHQPSPALQQQYASQKQTDAAGKLTHEDLSASGDVSGKVFGPFGHDTSQSPASQDDALAEDVSPASSALGSALTKSDKDFETCQSVSYSETPSKEYSSLTTKKDEFEGYAADTDESGAPRITSPYENVPSEQFFTSCESRIETDTRQMTSPSPRDAHSVEVETTIEDTLVAGSLSRHAPPGEDQTSEEVYMEIESKQKISTSVPSAADPIALDQTSLQYIKDEAEILISQVVITKTDVDSDRWSEIREDDEAFEARVKEEEQKIFGLMVDRRSQGTTPDTTPARTPTEEGTPTSEQNPFLFQEGKLFEMTRSGAIDMTKRNYADESFHFFQVGQQSQEEVSLSEEMKEATEMESAKLERSPDPFAPSESDETDIEEKDALTLASPVSELSDKSEEMTSTGVSVGTTKAELKSRIPIKMGISVSSKSPKKEIAASEASEVDPFSKVETDDTFDSSQVPCPISPEKSVIDVQLDFSTVTRSVYSEQDDESPDSSPEEQRSVIEIPTAVLESSVPSSESKSKIPVRTTPAAPQSLQQSEYEILPSDGFLDSLQDEIKDDQTKPKSKIPVKAAFQRAEQQCAYTETSIKKPQSPKALDMTCKLSMKQDNRSKSESDASVPMDPKTRRSIKARSYAEVEAETRERVDEMKLELESDDVTTARSKIFSSRLPVKGRSTPASHSTGSPTKEHKDHFFDLYKNSIEFFEEISDEASKLVDRLTQSEREQELISDDESSSALEVSVIENMPSIETQHSISEDIFDTRPIWDESIETQIERIPDENVHDRAEA